MQMAASQKMEVPLGVNRSRSVHSLHVLRAGRQDCSAGRPLSLSPCIHC